MEQRNADKVRLFRTLKVVFYCLGLPLFVLATLITAVSLFAGEAPFMGTAESDMFASIKMLFSGTALFGVWIAFGVWLVIAVVHIVVHKTVGNRRARTVIVAAVTLVTMLAPVAVMDLVIPSKLNSIASSAPEGVTVASYKDQLSWYNTKTSKYTSANGRRESYTDALIDSVDNALRTYNIAMSSDVKLGNAANGANTPVEYKDLWPQYTGEKTGLVKEEPDADGKLVIDGVVYEGYYYAQFGNKIPAAPGSSEIVNVTRYVWYKTSKMAVVKDGVYGYSGYNSNGMLSDGAVYSLEVALNIMEQYYYAEKQIAALGGTDELHDTIIADAQAAREEYYKSAPELQFIWEQSVAETEGFTLTQGELQNVLDALGSSLGAMSLIPKVISIVDGLINDGNATDGVLNIAISGGAVNLRIYLNENDMLTVVLAGSTFGEKEFELGLDSRLISGLADVLDWAVTMIKDGDGQPMYTNAAALLSDILTGGGEGTVGTISTVLNLVLGLVGFDLGDLLVYDPSAADPTEEMIYGLIDSLLGGLYWYNSPEILPVYDFYAEAASEKNKEIAGYYAQMDRAFYEGGLHGYMIGSALFGGSSLIAGDTVGNGTYAASVGLTSYEQVMQLKTDLSYQPLYYPLFSVRDMLLGFMPFVLLFVILSGIAAEREALYATGKESVKTGHGKKNGNSLGGAVSKEKPDEVSPDANVVADTESNGARENCVSAEETEEISAASETEAEELVSESADVRAEQSDDAESGGTQERESASDITEDAESAETADEAEEAAALRTEENNVKEEL